jgi:hypothetical protein
MKNPGHYGHNTEIYDFIRDQHLGFAEGNIIKYVCRYQKKNGLEDLNKAKHYLEMLIADLVQDELDNAPRIDERGGLFDGTASKWSERE